MVKSNARACCLQSTIIYSRLHSPLTFTSGKNDLKMCICCNRTAVGTQEAMSL